MKTCGHISFDMKGSDFGPECRYLIYMDSNINKTKTAFVK